MPAENILVTFWSRTGKTEKLALRAALGAVQAKAKIRLRWLREVVEDSELDSIPEWRVNRERMSKEYIEPRENDFAWADGMVIAIPAGLSLAATELKMYLNAFATARSSGKLRSRAAAVIVSGRTASDDDHSAAALLSAVLSDLRLTTVPAEPALCVDAVETARLQGRRLVEFLP
jgi:multimeric flavodoxin WrbA